MSHNVQKYDRQVYLRVSEAQRCRVHSTLVMPVFDVSRGDGSGTIDLAAAEAAAAGSGALRPVAVFELVQADRDVAFPEVIAQLRKCLLVSVCVCVGGGCMGGLVCVCVGEVVRACGGSVLGVSSMRMAAQQPALVTVCCGVADSGLRSLSDTGW